MSNCCKALRFVIYCTGYEAKILFSLVYFILILGNRFGTFMTYLSDVQAGGSTVFPVIGVKSEAIKGSAIFWLNLDHTNIQNNPLTYHGGCPVLVGSKWIFNKWIRANDQAMSQKCDLRYNNKPTETKNMFAEFRNTSKSSKSLHQ